VGMAWAAFRGIAIPSSERAGALSREDAIQHGEIEPCRIVQTLEPPAHQAVARAYTWQFCTLGGIMDCPTREQRQWLGDVEIELRVNGVADGTLDIARKFLLDASRDQWRDGAIPMVSDVCGSSTMLIDSYIFSFVNSLQAYNEETGDVKFVQRL
jgi:Bacterial alpha-L-rhamnosidase 6 hairpin glycosidase domain